MTQTPEPLTGGNATDLVVRIGDTVRKPWTPASVGVQALLAHLRAAGLAVPEPLGRDDQGRQVLEYLPGQLAMDSPPLDLDQLHRVGALVRAIHDASQSFVPPAGVDWQSLIPAPGADLICHQDLAPWNLVLSNQGGQPSFIDWDGAGPSTREWDLAYSAQAFTLNQPDQPAEQAAEALASFVAGYHPSPALRAALPEAMARRTEAMYQLLDTSRRTGFEPWATMFDQGHGAHWRAASDYVRSHRGVWARALA